MHILFLTDNFPPEVNAPASRTFEHAREWVKGGHQVTVITCAPNFPKGRVFPGYKNRLWQQEDLSGIRVIRVWSYIAANEGFARRVLDYMSYMMTATLAALFVRRVDVIVATSPQLFTALAGWITGLLKRRPWVFELRDIWPESIRAVGAMKTSRVLDMLERLELFLYRRATRVVTVTNAFRDNLIRRGINPQKIRVVTNGADLSRYKPQGKDPDLAAELSLQGKFVLGYIGTMGMAHGLGTLIDAMRQLSALPEGADLRLLMLGDGAAKAALQEKAVDLPGVIFLDSVPKEQVTRYWSLLDVALIHLKATDLFTTVIPSKLFECMAMGLPVIFGVKGEAAEIVRKSGCGVLTEPEDSVALAEKILKLQADPDMRAQISAAGIAAAPSWDRRVLASKMEDILQEAAFRG